eukprot:IDg20698t1
MIVMVIEKLIDSQFIPPTTAPIFSDYNCDFLESSDFGNELDTISLLQNLQDNDALDAITMHLASTVTVVHRVIGNKHYNQTMCQHSAFRAAAIRKMAQRFVDIDYATRMAFIEAIL